MVAPLQTRLAEVTSVCSESLRAFASWSHGRGREVDADRLVSSWSGRNCPPVIRGMGMSSEKQQSKQFNIRIKQKS